MEVVFYAVIATTIWFFISYASPCVDNPVFDQMTDTPAEASGIPSNNGNFKARCEGMTLMSSLIQSTNQCKY